MDFFTLFFTINFLMGQFILKPLIYTLSLLAIIYISLLNISTIRYEKNNSLIHQLFI